MSRYIDANVDETQYTILYKTGVEKQGVWEDVINKTPPDNVVEVVRCKDCKYHAEFSSKCNKLNLTPMWPSDYCSYGERADT